MIAAKKKPTKKMVVIPKVKGRVEKPAEPETKALVVYNDGEAALAMEARDEGQITASLKGEYVEDYVYSMEVNDGRGGKRKVTSLSWMGIQEAARAYGHIRTEIYDRRESGAGEMDPWIEFTIRAIDDQTGAERFGIKRQHKMKQGKNGAYPDPFYIEACLAKAQRNAIRQLIPQGMMRDWVTQFLKTRKAGQEFQPPAVQPGQYTPAAALPPAAQPANGQPAEARPLGMITEPQMKKIFVCQKDAGISDGQLKDWICKNVKQVTSRNQLTSRQASTVIEYLLGEIEKKKTEQPAPAVEAEMTELEDEFQV
ncbi:MAG TPA: hypothetical protein P5110_07440 [Candidatus Omnitrophota bacterium]|nr:hypothetical protein [Candidatus Omnitrophota bacterium]